MSWIWVGMGGALVLGVCLGVTLMSLLCIARDCATDSEQPSRLRAERRTMPC
jgi:hypothetical protein